jgi:hypothetical protein
MSNNNENMFIPKPAEIVKAVMMTSSEKHFILK